MRPSTAFVRSSSLESGVTNSFLQRLGIILVFSVVLVAYQLIVSFGAIHRGAYSHDNIVDWITDVGIGLGGNSNARIRHVVFSTYKCDLFSCPPARRVAESNSQIQWRNIVTNTANTTHPVAFLDFSDTTKNHIELNKFGVPVLSSMYLRAQRLYPNALTFTYVNADILPEPSFFDTVNVGIARGLVPFVMVGKRCNVNWSADNPAYQVNHTSFSFDDRFRQGELFIDLAEDYFVVSRNAIDWESIPKFVIGRIAFDNWLVDHAYHRKRTHLIDVTKTVRVIHQTDEDGNMAQGGKLHKDNLDDRNYNVALGKGKWDHGSTSDAHYESYYPEGGDNATPMIQQRVYWTIVVKVSKTSWDFLDNWLFFFRQLQDQRDFWVKKLVITCVDEESFLEYQTRILPPKAHLRTTADARTDLPSILLHELKNAPNLLYSDINAIWLSNPLVYVRDEDHSIWCAPDVTQGTRICRPGFFAFRNSQDNQKLLEDWAKLVPLNTLNNDPAEPESRSALNQILQNTGIRHKILASEQFPDGETFFEKQHKEGAVVAHNVITEVEDSDAKMNRFLAHGLWKASPDVTAQRQVNEGKKQKVSFKIIVLAVDEFEFLDRLLQSLKASDYQSDVIDLEVHFDRPANLSSEWQESVQRVSKFLGNDWKLGSSNVVVSETVVGTRKAWLDAWRPVSAFERVMIFRADSKVSSIWYKWLKGAYAAYEQRTDVASLSLQSDGSTSLVKKLADTGKPLMYNHLTSTGFSPKALLWRDFLDFAECAIAQNLSIEISSEKDQGHIPDHYYAADGTTAWQSLFFYFVNYHGLSALHPNPARQTAIVVSQDQGDIVLAQDSDVLYEYPTDLVALDTNSQPVQLPTRLRGLVMSAAIGYEKLFFVRFVKRLRQHYSGDIALLISESTPEDVRQFLKDNSVHIVETAEEGGPRESPGWHRINKIRYQFFQDSCQESQYDLCMTVDFRDILFQDNPFVNMTVPLKPTLHLYLHNLQMNGWALEGAMKCKGTNEAIRDKTMINAGGLIASPPVFGSLAWINQEYGATCDDQIALNMAIYSDALKDKNIDVILHKQGEGSVNNLAYGGTYTRDSRERFLNHNCFPAPAAHQLDLL